MAGLNDFGFYGILTAPRVGYERVARVMVERQIRFIQLRMKKEPRDKVIETARRLREIICPPSLFIINDSPEIAREVGADGVHLGQEDMPFLEAREYVGPHALIGLSTHNPVQIQRACALGPDYVGVGPVFKTPSKERPDPVIGIGGMQQMIGLATVPAVALGGLDLGNVKQVLAAGARNVSAVRFINESLDPARELDAMLKVIAELDTAPSTDGPV